jgi:hypothetical protein
MAGYLEDWVVKPGGQLFNKAAFSAALWAENVKRFGCAQEPDHQVTALFLIDVVGIGSGSEQGCRGVTPDFSARWLSAEDFSSVKLDRVKALKRGNSVGHDFS